MSVLLMRLAGPMQSWGTRSRFGHRDTDLEPGKSAVIGMLCAALGWPREAAHYEIAGQSYSLEDFARCLTMAVRVDRESRLGRDYHTVGAEPHDGAVLGQYPDGRNKGRPRPYGVRKADDSGVGVVVSERYYLADAEFLVGLAADRVLLERLDGALRRPVWPLFLGRKAFLPALPISEGVFEGDLMPVLIEWPRQMRGGEKPPGSLRFVCDAAYGAGEPRSDLPLSFVSRDRRFGVRHVLTEYHPLPQPRPEPPDVSEQPGH